MTKIIKNTKLNLQLDHYDKLAHLLVNDLEGVTIRRSERRDGSCFFHGIEGGGEALKHGVDRGGGFGHSGR